MITITEKVFSGDMQDTNAVAEMFTIKSLEPTGKGCCCVTQRKPIRYAFKTFETMQNPEVLPALWLVPELQSGSIKTPACCCCIKSPVIAEASGSCFDCGRYATFTRMTFQQAIDISEVATGGAPGLLETDEPAPSRTDPFKTHEEFAALPTRKSIWGFYEVVQQQPCA